MHSGYGLNRWLDGFVAFVDAREADIYGYMGITWGGGGGCGDMGISGYDGWHARLGA